MSRPLRLEHSGAIWHVTSRGDERRAIFRDDTYRERFLAILGSEPPCRFDAVLLDSLESPAIAWERDILSD